MTEKQLMKFNGKRVSFTFKETQYSIKSEVLEGVLTLSKEQVSIYRNGINKIYSHYGFYLKQDLERFAKPISYQQVKWIHDMVEVN